MANLIFTIYQDKILSALCENRKIIEVSLENQENTSILGNIYVGRVENVVKSINAAFVEIQKGVKGYYSLEENKNHIFLNSKNSDKVCIGDLLLVQVERDAIKTKAPILTSNLNLSGTYVALSREMAGSVSVSNKIKDKAIQKQLKEVIKPYVSSEYGFVARTNCEGFNLSEDGADKLTEEITNLVDEYNNILKLAGTRTAFTCMRGKESSVCEIVKNVRMEQIDEIITDHPDIFAQLKAYNDSAVQSKLHFYQDDLLPLSKLYSIDTQISDALKERVWLKSGGYLVIQPTEALTVIDVNTGKFIAGKSNNSREDGFYKVNCEAAVEIAKQLRLRNYSGIIIIDFIDMKLQEHNLELIKLLEQEVSKDPVQTAVIEITKLGLVELTRKKIKRPLYEQIEY